MAEFTRMNEKQFLAKWINDNPLDEGDPELTIKDVLKVMQEHNKYVHKSLGMRYHKPDKK